MINGMQAAGLLRTWLSECNIGCEVQGDRVLAYSRSGEKVAVDADPRQIMSTDLDTCMGAFHQITEKLGHGKPMPINRGKAPKKRIFDDNILARWRHTEMRTVPNQSSERLKELAFIAKREAYIFTSRNRHLCAEMGYDSDIAYNDAMIWMNTFLGRYSLENESETRKLLTNYLRQRFLEQKGGMDRERKNVIPGGAYHTYADGINDVDTTDPTWKIAHDQIGTRVASKRKAKASELLNASFQAIGHDSMVAKLRETIASHPCEDTKRAARGYLRQHIDGCSGCSAVGELESNE
jgi:hypothetical protein